MYIGQYRKWEYLPYISVFKVIEFDNEKCKVLYPNKDIIYWGRSFIETNTIEAPLKLRSILRMKELLGLAWK